MEKNMNALLLYALDNEPTPRQQADLENALAESEALRQEKEQLLQIRSLVADLRVRRDVAFSERVMHRLQKKEKRGFLYAIVSLSPKVAAACILFMLATTAGIYIHEGSLSSDVIIGIEDLMPEDAIGVQNDRLMRTSSDKTMEGPEKEKEKNR